MSATLPPVLDAWRMVSARRAFSGRLPLSGMPRLRPVLADAEGDCRFEVEFGVDALGMRYVEVRAEADLPLLCQRTLERFLHPVRIDQRLQPLGATTGGDHAPTSGNEAANGRGAEARGGAGDEGSAGHGR